MCPVRSEWTRNLLQECIIFRMRYVSCNLAIEMDRMSQANRSLVSQLIWEREVRTFVCFSSFGNLTLEKKKKQGNEERIGIEASNVDDDNNGYDNTDLGSTTQSKITISEKVMA